MLVMMLAVIAGMLSGTPKVAQAVNSWPIEVGTGFSNSVKQNMLISHPNGRVSLGGCYNGGTESSTMRTYNTDGSLYGNVPRTQEGDELLCSLDGSVNKDGIVYMTRYNNTIVQSMSLVAYKGSKIIWEYSFGQGLCGGMAFPADSFYSSVVGKDGNLYLLLTGGYCEKYEFVSLSSSTGYVKYRKVLQMPGGDPNSWSNTIQVYKDGLVINENRKMFRYFSYKGVEDKTRKFEVALDAYEGFHNWALQMNGDIYVSVTHTHDPNLPESCNAKEKVDSYTSRIVRRTFTKKTITNDTSQLCIVMDELKVTPNGGVIAAQVRYTFDDSSIPGSLIMLDSTNGKISTIPLPKMAGIAGFDIIRNIDVDIAGNIVISRTYYPVTDDGSSDRHVEVVALNSKGKLLARFSTDIFRTERNDQFDIVGNIGALSEGYVYLVLSQWGYNNQLYKIRLENVHIDYPRGMLLGVKPANIRDYVALGDSFSSGEGAEPFDPKTNISKKNECHRSRVAYAEVLDKDLALDLDLQAFTACSGSEVKHVVGDSKQKESKYQEKLQYLALNKNTDTVTMTIGGNDAGFKKFLMQCLFFDCSNSSVNKEFYANVKANRKVLETAYGKILGRAPNAQVYIPGYPQLLPADKSCNHTDNWMRLFDVLVANATLNAGLASMGLKYNRVPIDIVKRLGSEAGLSTKEVEAFIKTGEFTFSKAEQAEARKFVDALNKSIGDSTKKAGNVDADSRKKPVRLHFVSATTKGSPFLGHELCTSKPYFNGLIADKAVFSFHPNAAGHQAYAKLIKSNIG